jgi:hypothetical protein
MTKDVALHKITELYHEWFKACPNITSKFRTMPCLKASLNKITIQIALVGMSMIFYSTILNLSACNVS